MKSILSAIFLRIKFLNSYSNSPFTIRNFLLKSQFFSKDEIKRYQLSRLHELIDKASRETPYYKNLLSGSKMEYESLNEFDSLFPVLTKNSIRENSESLINKEEKQTFLHSTSGSTGDPIKVQVSDAAEAYRKASFMRFLDWYGLKLYDRSVLLWGFKKNQNQKNSSLSGFKRYLRNRLDLNVFELNSETVMCYYEQILKFDPKYIRGYKSAVLSLAKLIDENKLEVDFKSLKIAIVTSEILFESEKKYMESILGCKVVNEYGSAECGLFAYECPDGSLHVNEESVYLRTDSNNFVYATELNNSGMPLINYFNNDKVILANDSCQCGRTSRVIEKIEGRVDDYIKCPDGSEKSQYVFYYIVKELEDLGMTDSIVKYKIIQNGMSFKFCLVPGVNYDSEVEDHLRKRIVEEIGKEISISVKKMTSIPLDKSGKLRFFERIE